MRQEWFNLLLDGLLFGYLYLANATFMGRKIIQNHATFHTHFPNKLH